MGARGWERSKSLLFYHSDVVQPRGRDVNKNGDENMNEDKDKLPPYIDR